MIVSASFSDFLAILYADYLSKFSQSSLFKNAHTIISDANCSIIINRLRIRVQSNAKFCYKTDRICIIQYSLKLQVVHNESFHCFDSSDSVCYIGLLCAWEEAVDPRRERILQEMG